MANKIMLCEGDFGWDYTIVNTKTDESILIQTDWDYIPTATVFGWRGEDSTKNPSDQIAKAQNYLDNHIGKIVIDPGYFD